MDNGMIVFPFCISSAFKIKNKFQYKDMTKQGFGHSSFRKMSKHAKFRSKKKRMRQLPRSPVAVQESDGCPGRQWHSGPLGPNLCIGSVHLAIGCSHNVII